LIQSCRTFVFQINLLSFSGFANIARDEGRAEGRVEGILEIAAKMKNAGQPLGEIEEFTGIPAETIEQM
jgi:predicted transposase YdaD